MPILRLITEIASDFPMDTRHHVYLSYARADFEEVQAVARELTALGIDVWLDSSNLLIGTSWLDEIEKALSRSSAIIAFLSPRGIQSMVILEEISRAQAQGKQVIPVLMKGLEQTEVPTPLASVRAIVLAADTKAEETARLISEALAQHDSSAMPASAEAWLSPADSRKLAEAFVAQAKNVEAGSPDDVPNSVFVVHGHDEAFLEDVVSFLSEVGIEAVVMKDMGGAARSLLDRFFEFGGKAHFAIVLLSADDLGAARRQYDEPGVATQALKFRARQNVILELGYFYGMLGWDSVFVLEKAAHRYFPDFERPSDLGGVLFDRYDAAGKWKIGISQKLTSAGFALREPAGS